MNNGKEYSREELEKMIEKAKKDLEERLAQMSPEERRQAELKAQQAIKDDEAERKRLLESAAAVAAGTIPEKKTNFCPNCGAKAGSGKFCEYCGSPLK